MANKYSTLPSLLTAIANSIRGLTGGAASIKGDDLPDVIAGFGSGSATTPSTTITSNPSLSINSTTGLVTASHSKTQSVTPTVVAGYVSSGTAGNITASGSGTLQLTTKAAETFNVSSSNQTISGGQYLLGAQTIRAVTTSGISAGNIKTGVTIKVGDAGDDDRIAGVAGTFTAASTVSSGQTAAGAAQILSGYSAWVNGAEVKGSIASLAATTYNTSSSDQTITSGKYISGTQTIKAVTTSGISASNIKKNVVIKVGDANDDDRITNVTGTFTSSTTVSSGQTAAAAGQIVSGYSAWVDGAEVKGSLSASALQTGTLSASGSGSASITSASFGWDSTNTRWNITGSASISGTATASVTKAGLVSTSTTGSGSVSGTASLAAVVARIAGSVGISGTLTYKPSIAKHSNTNVSTGTVTTSKPSSGYYVAINSAANTGTITGAATISTAGYGNASHHGITNGTATVGASASDITYVPITSGSATTPATTITKNPTISIDAAGKITSSYSGSQSVTPTVSAGYIASGTAGTISTSGSATYQMTTKAATTYNTSSSDQTIASSTYLTGTQTIKAVTTSNISAANIKAGVVAKVGDANNAGRIVNVTGTFTSDATAAAGDIVSGKTAYINGNKITGTLVPMSASWDGETFVIGGATWNNETLTV